MMDLHDYRQRAAAWLREHSPGPIPTDLEGRFEALREWQRTLYAGGWVGIDWPVDAGGQGLTARHHLVFAEELARSGHPEPVGNIGLDVVGPAIVKFGTSEQRSTLLPALLRGDEVWCQGFSEPEAGSDLAAVRTKAVRDGDKYRVSGQKVWTSWGQQADHCAVLVRTESPQAATRRHAGLAFLLVPMDSPGVTVRPLVQLTGDAEFSEVFLDEVEVPASRLLGQPGDGWTIAMHMLSSERSFYAIRRRVEFERALASIVAELRGAGATLVDAELEDLGAAAVVLRILRAQTEATVERLLDEAGPTPVDSIDKMVLTDAEQTLYRNAIRLVGADRMVPVGRVGGVSRGPLVNGYLYSRAASIYGGTAQIQRNIVAERQLGLRRAT